MDATAFALKSPRYGLIGFGQVRFLEQTHGHLAHIIVSPHHRGRGFGRILCTALMRKALCLHPITGYSLYVFPDNPKAIALYRSLGFTEAGMHEKFNCLLMLAPLSGRLRPVYFFGNGDTVSRFSSRVIRAWSASAGFLS